MLADVNHFWPILDQFSTNSWPIFWPLFYVFKANFCRNRLLELCLKIEIDCTQKNPNKGLCNNGQKPLIKLRDYSGGLFWVQISRDWLLKRITLTRRSIFISFIEFLYFRFETGKKKYHFSRIISGSMKQNLIKLEQNCDKTYVLISVFRAPIISIREIFYFCRTKAIVSSGKISVIVTHYTVLYDLRG